MNSLIKCCNFTRRLIRVNYTSLNQISKLTNSKDINEIPVAEITENEKQIYNKVDESYQQYKARRVNESVEVKKARLIYQSRKRGTSENGILLANFATKYLTSMSEIQLDEFDRIISSLYNEWDIYYWITDSVPIPQELESNSVIHKLKEFCLSGENKI
jgi:succinate dehydrogenase assembly factor 2